MWNEGSRHKVVSNLNQCDQVEEDFVVLDNLSEIT
jgi:hypothetical protein